MDRTLVVVLIAVAVVLVTALGSAFAGGSENAPPSRDDRIERSADEWKQTLTEQEFRILREKGTERPFTSELLNDPSSGAYVCAGCGLELFHSDHKFDSGTGWPSFFQPVSDGRVDRHSDVSLGMVRTEATCARCGGHLGHVFRDGPKPTGERYCINGVALDKKKPSTQPAATTP